MQIDRDALTRYAALRIRNTGHATSLRQGDRRSPFLGRGVEFADYRPYDTSDDIRLIDWNVYLRLGTALIRQFNEERSLSVELCLDTSASMRFGRPRKADHAAQLTAALALISLAHRDPVDLICFGGARLVRARASNFEGMSDLLHLLERMEPGGHGDAATQISSRIGTRRIDRLIVITDLLIEADRREALLRLMAASSTQSVLLHVLSEDELRPNFEQMHQIVDTETGETFVVRGDRAAARAYAENLERWFEEIRRRCTTLGVRYVPAHNVNTVAELVQGELRRSQLVEHAAGSEG